VGFDPNSIFCEGKQPDTANRCLVTSHLLTQGIVQKNKAAKRNKENNFITIPVRRNRPYGYEYSQVLRPRAHPAELCAGSNLPGKQGHRKSPFSSWLYLS